MTYDVLKALHIIFVVTWFAGLFYLFRLFIYHREAIDKPAAERDVLVPQFRIMERRLVGGHYIAERHTGYWIRNSADRLESGVVDHAIYVGQAWVCGALVGLHGCSARKVVLAQCQKGTPQASSMRLRFLNEVPTVILIAVVFLIVLRDAVGWVWGVAAFWAWP